MKSTLVRRVLLVLLIIVLLAAIVPGIHYYEYLESHVSTDDAYVDGTVGLISSRIKGTVVAVYVEDNWRVRAGDVLLRLDPRDYEIKVAEAQARLERARQAVDQLYAQVDAAQAGVKLAESQRNQDRIDYDRARQLNDQGVVSHEYFDQATTALNVGVATESLAKHQKVQAEAALGGDPQDHSRYDRPVVQQAQADLDEAKLALSYTIIRAPFDGIVTRKDVHIGHRVEVGEPLMALVPAQGLYITANFKETQLTDVRVGQPAEIEADIYPGYIYHGHVDSISIGTGAAFALLPPENATGNWVKVVQRVPVKIVLDQAQPEDKPLRLGLSVEATIDINNTNGKLLTSTLEQNYHQGSQIPESMGNGMRPLDNGLPVAPSQPQQSPLLSDPSQGSAGGPGPGAAPSP